MPETKMKPAAPPEAPKPEERKPTATELRQAEAKRQFEALRGFAESICTDMNEHDFELLQTFKLIMDRERGSTTPIEEFITSVVLMYGLRDDDGKGLTLDDIQRDVDQYLTGNQTMEQAIREAHFLAARYPRPEPEPANQ